jgi:hypothetical protein
MSGLQAGRETYQGAQQDVQQRGLLGGFTATGATPAQQRNSLLGLLVRGHLTGEAAGAVRRAYEMTEPPQAKLFAARPGTALVNAAGTPVYTAPSVPARVRTETKVVNGRVGLYNMEDGTLIKDLGAPPPRTSRGGGANTADARGRWIANRVTALTSTPKTPFTITVDPATGAVTRTENRALSEQEARDRAAAEWDHSHNQPPAPAATRPALRARLGL